MGQKNKVIVKIHGQEYSVVGAEPKEYLLKVSSFVDDKMETIAKANTKLSTSMIAVLTCINIADQYLKVKDHLEEIEKEIQQPRQEISELEKHIETLHNELNNKDEICANLEKKIEEIETGRQEDEQIGLLKKELSDKENDLEKTQILINDLQNKLFANQIKLVEVTNELDECMRKNSL
ncbi:MAG: cell division protein ZapA [Natronincolaceae bacterium]|jgi:cell division protein ZapA|nr:cell division protein ZapA [Bacillota bacterium]NLK90097.1 cell division protein ZapA [Clostridiales bacterium]